MLAGALVAADRQLHQAIVAILVVGIGALHGFLTGSALAQASSAMLELTGTLVALTIGATLVAGLVVSLQVVRARVAMRVLASWIATTGLLMIGWSLRSGR